MTYTIIMLLLLATLKDSNSLVDIPALYIFGDSTVDVGTNNFLETVVRCNFQPYGRDLESTLSKGRFSNGLLVPDYIAQALGLPYPLAYLDPEAQGDRLLQGVNFASAGSGWVDSTAELLNVLTAKQQIEDLKDYKSKLVGLVGGSRSADILGRALYLVSTGSNDYLNNYFVIPFETNYYNLSQWQDRMIDSATQFLQELYNIGARQIVLGSLPAIGCLPAAITVHGEGKDQCVAFLNNAAASFNSAVQSSLLNLQRDLPGARFVFADIFGPLLQAVDNPSAYGVQETRNGCCGTGKIEVAIFCAASPGTCSDASKYLFFDSYHPSQAFYEKVSKTIFKQLTSTL